MAIGCKVREIKLMELPSVRVSEQQWWDLSRDFAVLDFLRKEAVCRTGKTLYFYG
jgi:hypothetical protein